MTVLWDIRLERRLHGAAVGSTFDTIEADTIDEAVAIAFARTWAIHFEGRMYGRPGKQADRKAQLLDPDFRAWVQERHEARAASAFRSEA